jgi:hypothetical protein
MVLTEDVLERLIARQSEWPLRLVREVYVFGSFARGAQQPGDVDLNVEFDHDDEQWTSTWLESLSHGGNPHRVFTQPLVGRKRSVRFLFDGRKRTDFDMTLLWRHGDDLQMALARLHAIEEDPDAGRAPRHAMLPQFEGMEEWLSRSTREYLVEAIGKGALRVERLVLKDEDLDDRLVAEHVNERWSPNSPLRRAACAVFGYLIDRGIDPAHVHLHGRDVRDPVTPYFAGFSMRYLRAMPRCLTVHGGKEWIEVVHPTRRGELLALRILPVSTESLEKIPGRP